MGFVNHTANTKEYDAAIKQLFGSYNGYIKSPLLAEVKSRISYLFYIQKAFNNFSTEYAPKIKWYDLVNKIRYYFFINIALKSINKDLRELVGEYMKLYLLPYGPMVHSLKPKFDKLMVKCAPLAKALELEDYKNGL